MAVKTIPELFLTAVRERPRPDCFSYRDHTGQYVDVSSEEAHRRVRALRFGLKSLGIKRGAKVALLAENRLEWALADLAILCAGAVTVPIYPTLLPDTIEFILTDCQPAAIFVSNQEQAEKIHGIREGLPFLQDVIAFDETDLPNIMPLAKLMQIGNNVVSDNPPPPSEDCLAVDPDDLASIIYTSGTTGNPKGVMLSHWNFVSNVLAATEIIKVSPDDRCLSFLPLSHVFERMGGFFTMLYGGVGIAYAERMDTVPRDMQDVHPTVVVSVPRLYEKIYARVLGMAMAGSPLKKNIFFWAREVGLRWGRLKREGEPIPFLLRFQFALADRLVFKKLRARTGGKLRFFVSGGAPLAPKINEFFYAAGLIVMEGYGLTETSPVLTANSFENYKIGSVGKVAPGTEIRIAEDGEIMARGPQIMMGYFNNEAATRAVLADDGWFATGDIGHLDEEGFLFITDRKKDVIVTAGGKNIAPQPIEEAIKVNKFVTQALVIGDKKPYLSCLIAPNLETVKDYAIKRRISFTTDAGLLSHPDVKALFADQIDKINAKLPSFNQVKEFALVDREFTLENGELTPTLKIKRWVVMDKYRALIDTLYPAEAEMG